MLGPKTKSISRLTCLAIFSILLFLGATAVNAQKPPTLVRPDDPLNRDPTRPDMSEYEKNTATAANASRADALIKRAQEAFSAKPPRYADAESLYLEAAKANPKEAKAYLGLGTVYAAENRADDSIKAMQKAVELKPKMTEAHFNLGLLYHAVGKQDLALQEYETLRTLDKSLADKLKQAIGK